MSRTKLAVQFGTVSIGQDTARLGIKIDREDLELSEAEDLLCGRRLKGNVKTARTNEDPNQQELQGMEKENHMLSSMFDVKRIGVSPKDITAGLTFALKGLDVSELGHFAKRSGWLEVESVADLDDEDLEDDDDSEIDAEVNGSDAKTAAAGR